MPNGSFEEYWECPTDFNQVSVVKYWSNPTNGSPDYFNSCSSNSFVCTPSNGRGVQNPKSGKAYVGLFQYFSFLDSLNDDLEYIQTKLIAPLVQGKTYRFSMSLSLAEISKYCIYNIGIKLSKHSLNNDTGTVIIIEPSFIINECIFEASTWKTLEFDYVANGDEEYLTIGNFSYSQNTNVEIIKPSNSDECAYYFIDDVNLFQINNDTYSNIFTPNNDGYNDFFTLNFDGLIGILKIFNRWGVLVYENQAENQILWNGYLNGNVCSDGTYYYILKLSNNIIKNGSIYLLK